MRCFQFEPGFFCFRSLVPLHSGSSRAPHWQSARLGSSVTSFYTIVGYDEGLLTTINIVYRYRSGIVYQYRSSIVYQYRSGIVYQYRSGIVYQCRSCMYTIPVVLYTGAPCIVTVYTPAVMQSVLMTNHQSRCVDNDQSSEPMC